MAKIDYSKFSLADLEKHKSLIEEAIVQSQAQRKQEALDAINKVASEFGFDAADLLGARKGAVAPKKKAPRPDKFQDPMEPENRWSGLGRKPIWFQERLSAGVPKEDMLIDKQSEPA